MVATDVREVYVTAELAAGCKGKSSCRRALLGLEASSTRVVFPLFFFSSVPLSSLHPSMVLVTTYQSSGINAQLLLITPSIANFFSYQATALQLKRE